MMVMPRVRRTCADSRRRRAFPSVAVTAGLAVFLAASPRQRSAAATSSSTMEESSDFDAEAADDPSDDSDDPSDDGDDRDDDSDDDSSSTPSPSPSPTPSPSPSPTTTPELMTVTDPSAAAPTAAPTAAPAGAPQAQGSLGAGMVKGTLSATGVSQLLVDAVGEEGIIQAVRACERVDRFAEEGIIQAAALTCKCAGGGENILSFFWVGRFDALIHAARTRASCRG